MAEASQLDMLVEMGFERERAEIALRKAPSKDLQGAIDWLEKNQEKSTEEIQAEDVDTAAGSDAQAQSLVCNECGKKFRSTAQAEFHASKTEHTDFSESTEEIKPLTAEEKAAKLEALRAKLAEKRAGEADKDKEERKQNEAIRRKATKESQDIKEDLQKKERLKEAAAKKKEKQDEIEARKRVQAKIEADKAERRRKAELEKAARAGQPVLAEAPPQAAPAPSAPRTTASYGETRLRLQTPVGTIQKAFPADTTIFEVAQAIQQEQNFEVSTFTSNFPKKTFDQTDFGQTLKEAGWVPSAALIVK